MPGLCMPCCACLLYTSPHCHNPLPLPNYGKYPTIFISVVGITTCGKTVYLNQLLTRLAMAMQNTGYYITENNLPDCKENVEAKMCIRDSDHLIAAALEKRWNAKALQQLVRDTANEKDEDKAEIRRFYEELVSRILGYKDVFTDEQWTLSLIHI